MPPEILELLKQCSHIECSSCELYANNTGLGEENDTIMEDNLNNQVKIAQDAHYK